MPAPRDITGQRFGMLLALHVVNHHGAPRLWLCQCDCGRTTLLRVSKLTCIGQKSCGCMRAKWPTIHGESGGRYQSKKYSVEYKTWERMKRRCYYKRDRNYWRYGGRGIAVCEEWQTSFSTFLHDMGRRPASRCTIERIDNDGDYSPKNCKWATHAEQNRNKSTNRLIAFNGETLCLTDWAHRVGIKPVTLDARLRRGWNIQHALTTPVIK